MSMSRREFLKKIGIVTVGVAVASVVPSVLLAKIPKEKHFEAPPITGKSELEDTHLRVYKNDVLQVHTKDYRTDWVPLPGDTVQITRSLT